jgi:hypothetical protein
MPLVLSFVHPLLMWVLLGLILYSGFLGYKASQVRKVDAAERKAMIPLRYGQRHAALGRWIVALTLLGSFGGMAVTYLNNVKLFVGPHLIAAAVRLAGHHRSCHREQAAERLSWNPVRSDPGIWRNQPARARRP